MTTESKTMTPTCGECGSDLDAVTCPVCLGEPIERATGWCCGECDATGKVWECVVCKRRDTTQESEGRA